MPAPNSRRRRLVLIAAAILLVIAAVAGAAYLIFIKAPGDVSNPTVTFKTETTPLPTPPPPPKPTKVKTEPVGRNWPLYGYNQRRTRAMVDVPATLRPPFRRRWKVSGKVLLEFAPALLGNRLYQLSDAAKLRAFDKRTGRMIWGRSLGHLAASTPAAAGGVLYSTVLEATKGSPGRIVAVRAKDGLNLWTKNLSSRTESSPVVSRGRVFFGTENGTVYALDIKNGREIWKYEASGAVKGGLALSGGYLIFGDYGGQVHSIRSSDGKRRWSTGSSGGSFGRSGTFYATASVKYGRVYIGNTDGRMYSFAEKTGEMAWATRTDGYVYSAAAVATVKGLGPTVFAGSYDGKLYAFDAKSGAVRWSTAVGGRVSGGVTLIGEIVYIADLGRRYTHGIMARTGKEVFTFPDGGFDTAISDGRWIFLTGYTNLYALEPIKSTSP
ncbi:MAG: PQQ-binding-like beta-propeller repeat protein [Actinomycetota bacterium]